MRDKEPPLCKLTQQFEHKKHLRTCKVFLRMDAFLLQVSYFTGTERIRHPNQAETLF